MAENDTNLSENSLWTKNENGTVVHKTEKDKFGNPITRYSQQDIFDRNGLKVDSKEKEADKREASIKQEVMGKTGPRFGEELKQQVKDVSESHPQAEVLVGTNNSKEANAKAKELTKEHTKTNNLTKEGEHLFDETTGKTTQEYNNKLDNYKAAEEENEKVQSIFDKINDYYDDSLTGVYKNASDDDKRLFTADAILTTLKNIAKAKPYIGSIYGRSHEGSDVGNEKSLLEKSIEKSLEQGLDRRNKRLNASLETQIMNAQLPSELKKEYLKIAQNNNLDFAQKKRLMDLEFQNYTKRGDYDVDKLRATKEVEANAPHRLSGGFSAGPFNFGVH